jgi:hypothetical protein
MRHALRIFLLALALVLIGLALTPKATPAQETGPCDPHRPIPYWWHLRPAQPCGGDSVTLVFNSCRPCVEILGCEWSNHAQPLRLDLRMLDVCLLDVCLPDSLEVPLGRLAVGYHQLNYGVRAGVVFGDSGFCYVERPDSLRFMVGCPEPPPGPPPGPLPFTSLIQVGPPPPCAGCPPRICPGRPIPFLIAGWFPDGCCGFRGLELLPSPIMAPGPQPPVVRIHVDCNTCEVCIQSLQPWCADTVLAGLPPGNYQLMMEMVVTSLCDSIRTDTTTYRANLAFAVKDSCPVPTPEPCLMADWEHAGSFGACDAIVGPGRPAKVGMILTTQVPLAGVQGRLSFAPAGLRIARLVPTGQAEGMHIAWERRGDGADFVMFAERGAPIVPLRCNPGVRCIPPPALTVVLEPIEGAVLPPVTHLRVHDLLGSDSLGNAVPECQIATLVVVEARICSGPSCDLNLDGQLDVRDLVSMVHCVLGNGPCPDTSLARLDCNGDGRLGVDDVLCCARVILCGGERDTMPGRPEPNVTVQIGEAAWEAGGLRVPVRVFGADRLGAARLALTLPLDRYEVSGVELAAANPQWLALHEVVDGRLVLGLVGLGPEVPAEEPEALELTLRLALRSGQAGGGEVGLADLQASGPDGVTLELSTSPAPVPLPLPGALMLSAARPNPFTRETSFALNLDRATDVDLAVHDLSGRRVATLFRGVLGAGPHEFAWRGMRGDGSPAANGIYFLQARVGAERLARKVVFLRGD